jgi:5-methyltetrahydropteroyltriglutamate--homocysteine methyltransferase
MERNIMKLTTTVVGSYTRPDWLISEIHSSREDTQNPLRSESLEEYKQQAKILTIKQQEEAGIDVINDGEQGRTSFYEYLVEAAKGFRIHAIARPANPSLIDQVEYGETRKITRPLIVDKLEWRGQEPLTVRDARFLKRWTRNKTKITIASPSLILRRMWKPTEAYPSYDGAKDDVVRLSEKEVAGLVREKVDFVQLDAPELTTYADDRIDDVTMKEQMQNAVEVINRVVSNKIGSRIGVHVCWGNYRGTHRADGKLARIYPWLLDLKVNQLVLELASARHEEDIEVLREYPSKMEIGAGVIDVKTPDVEPVRVVQKRIKKLLELIDADKLWLNSDCGFASNFQSTLVPRSSCYEKLHALALAAANANN